MALLFFVDISVRAATSDIGPICSGLRGSVCCQTPQLAQNPVEQGLHQSRQLYAPSQPLDLR